MKKFLVIALVLGISLSAIIMPLVCPTVAYATAALVDLNGYSDDEIVTLLAQVQNEVINRRIERTATLSAGSYIVGDDIPAGKYIYAVIVNKDVVKYNDGFNYGIVYARSIEDADDEYPSKLYENVDNTEEFSHYLSLEDGDILRSPVPFTLTVSGGLMFK